MGGLSISTLLSYYSGRQMSDHGVEIDKKGMRIRFPCGCRITLKAEDGSDIGVQLPIGGTAFQCKHGHTMRFTGPGKCVFSGAFGTIYSMN